jgi:hypothetical protein
MSTNEAAHEAAVDVSGSDLPCLDLSQAVWKKSSYSGGNGNCVEVADLGEHIAVRDSKDRNGPKLVFAREVWRTFLANVKTDHSTS